MAINFPQVPGPDSGSYTPETLARRRKLAEAMLGQSMGVKPIEHWTQGLAQMLQAGIGGYHARQADELEASERERSAKMFAEILGQGADADMGAMMGALSDPWASDANVRLGQLLLGEQMNNRRQQAAWDREDQLKAEDLARPDWQTFDVGGDIYRYNQNDPNSTPSLFFDGPDAAPSAPEVKTIFDPETGREITVHWTGAGEYGGWSPIGGVQAPKDPLVQVNTGDGAPGLGKLSTDYGYVLDPLTGEPKIDPNTGLPTAAPVPGSPAALEIERRNAAAAAGDQTEGVYADVVREDIDRALALLEQDPTFTTGLFGQVLGNLRGSTADRLDQFLNTVRSNVAFDRLQQMREASPTGGALGAVTERELALLQSAIGSLERSNPDDLAYNLRRVQQIYDQVMQKAAAYPNAGQFGFNGAGPAPRGGQSAPANIDDILKGYGL